MELPYNRIIHLQDGDSELVVSDVHDSVRRFRQTPNYDYLQYWDTDDNSLKAFWLGREVLNLLVDNGIPETWRDTVTQEEFDLYTDNCGFAQADFEREFEGYNFTEGE